MKLKKIYRILLYYVGIGFISTLIVALANMSTQGFNYILLSFIYPILAIIALFGSLVSEDIASIYIWMLAPTFIFAILLTWELTRKKK